MPQLKPLIGSVFFAGFLPNAPGTWGSFFALIPIYIIGNFTPFYGILLFVLLCSLLTIWVAEDCEKAWGGDPSPLVMDEWAGQAMTFVFITFYDYFLYDLLLLLAGFLIFRFFDILKPLGVDKLQKLQGGFGILMDDLLAGFYSFICLKAIIFFLAF